MDYRQQLALQIKSMEASIASQERTYDLATACLAERRAAFSVTRAAATLKGIPLSPADVEFFRRDVVEAYGNAEVALRALGDMRRELRELEYQLLLHDA